MQDENFMDIKQYTASLLDRVRKTSPLVHNITNFVVMNSSANILLAIGASPVMAHCISEVEEMTNLANALVLNIGTLDETWVEVHDRSGQSRQFKKNSRNFRSGGRRRDEAAHGNDPTNSCTKQRFPCCGAIRRKFFHWLQRM